MLLIQVWFNIVHTEEQRVIFQEMFSFVIIIVEIFMRDKLIFSQAYIYAYNVQYRYRTTDQCMCVCDGESSYATTLLPPPSLPLCGR